MIKISNWISVFVVGLCTLTSTELSATTDEAMPFLVAQERAEQIHLVRLVSGSFSRQRSLGCRYKYKVEIIDSFKGEMSREFYSFESAVIGARYLIIGNAEGRCGTYGWALGFPGRVSMLPLLPLGYDAKDDASWVAVGSTNYIFPPEVREVGGNACYLPTETGNANPCTVPPPVVNYGDLKKLMGRSGLSSVTDK